MQASCWRGQMRCGPPNENFGWATLPTVPRPPWCMIIECWTVISVMLACRVSDVAYIHSTLPTTDSINTLYLCMYIHTTHLCFGTHKRDWFAKKCGRSRCSLTCEFLVDELSDVATAVTWSVYLYCVVCGAILHCSI